MGASLQEIGCEVYVPCRVPCHVPCHDHAPLELGPMELQLGQLVLEQVQVDQQPEQTRMERVRERVLMMVRHEVVTVTENESQSLAQTPNSEVAPRWLP